MPAKRITRDCRQRMVLVARCQLFGQHTQPEDLRAGLDLMAATHLIGWEAFQGVEEVNQFIAENHSIIDPIVADVIERGLKAGPR